MKNCFLNYSKTAIINIVKNRLITNFLFFFFGVFKYLYKHISDRFYKYTKVSRVFNFEAIKELYQIFGILLKYVLLC